MVLWYFVLVFIGWFLCCSALLCRALRCCRIVLFSVFCVAVVGRFLLASFVDFVVSLFCVLCVV